MNPAKESGTGETGFTTFTFTVTLPDVPPDTVREPGTLAPFGAVFQSISTRILVCLFTVPAVVSGFIQGLLVVMANVKGSAFLLKTSIKCRSLV